MSNTKKIATAILMAVGVVLLSVVLLDRYFFRTGENRSPELVDFRPKDISIKPGGPLFYLIGKQLFYSDSENLNFNQEAIWSGKISIDDFHDVQVSPDNQYIAFTEGKKMIILRKDGKIVKKISPISKTTLDRDRKSGNFIGENFQWSSDSKKLFLLFDKKWGNRNQGNESSIFEYSLDNDNLSEVISLQEECSGSFFFDLSYRNIYYVIYSGSIKRIQLANQRDVEFYEKSGIKIHGINKDSIFINFTNAEFGNWDSKGTNLFTESESRFYLLHTSDSMSKTVFRTKMGVSAFKGAFYGFRSGHSGFFPNDKFYYTGSWAKDFEGTIFINAETLEYSFKEIDFQCFYSRTNLDHKEFALRYEIEPDLKFETSYQLLNNR